MIEAKGHITCTTPQKDDWYLQHVHNQWEKYDFPQQSHVEEAMDRMALMKNEMVERMMHDVIVSTRDHYLDAIKYGLMVPNLAMNIGETNMALLQANAGMISDKKIAKKLKEIKKDSLETRNWEFEVPHSDVICYREILENLSRENPVAFVTQSVDTVVEREIKVKKKEKVIDEYKVVEKTKIIKEHKRKVVRQVAFIHESIINKAQVVHSQSVDDALTTDFYGVFALNFTEGMTIQNVTEWVKNIKKAEWGAHADRETIHIVIPKI